MTIIKFGQGKIALIIGRKSVLMEIESDAVNVPHLWGEQRAVGCGWGMVQILFIMPIGIALIDQLLLHFSRPHSHTFI